MKHVLRVLKKAEKALKEGNDNCGGQPDNVYYEPLQQVRAEIKRLIAMGPAWSVCVQHAAGEARLPEDHVRRCAEALRGL